MPTTFGPLLVLAVTALGFAWYFKIAQKQQSSKVDRFFQAGRNIGIPLFTQTTWGSSFAFGNSIFYGLWLGYSMGLSALWLQVLWAVGMAVYAWILPRLIPYTENHTLHGFLGSQYGNRCRVVASVVSVTGLIILLGFELSFAAQYFAQVTGVTNLEWLIVLVAAVFFATFCSIGGFQANSRTDRLSNHFALAALVMLIVVTVARNWTALGPAFTSSALSTSLSNMSSQSGLAITGIAFFALFNIVDMTNWQTVSANSLTAGSTSAGRSQQRQMQRAMLRAAGLFLIAPVLTATTLGYMVKHLGLGTNDQAQFMSHFVSGLLDDQGIAGALLLALVSFAFVASSLSGVDSWMLATAQTISWDLIDYDTFKERGFNVARFDDATHERVTRRARIALLIIGIGGACGVYIVSKFVWNRVFELQFVIFGGGLAMLPAIAYALFRGSGSASTVTSTAAFYSIVGGYGSAIALFITSLLTKDSRLVEPLPVVSLIVATVILGIGLLLRLVTRRAVKRPLEEV